MHAHPESSTSWKSRGSEGSYRAIFRTWLPLGLTQLLTFGADPVYVAVIMRLGHPVRELGSLYAYAWPLILMLASPGLIMSTLGNVFGKNLENLRRTRLIALVVGAAGTLLISLVAFSPVGTWLLLVVLDVPDSEYPMARGALRICAVYPMLKSLCMLYQGVLIRGGRADDVLYSRVLRLIVCFAVLFGGLGTKELDGAALGATAIMLSLMCQLVYTWWRVGRVRSDLAIAPLDPVVVTTRRLLRFFLPLAMTPIVGCFTMLLMAAALGRLPGVIASLAVWPIVSNFNQVGISIGKSFDQVTMKNIGNPASQTRLFRFGLLLGLGAMLLGIGLNGSGLFASLLSTLEDLDGDTITITCNTMWILAPMPLIYTLCAYYRGLLAHALRTVPILIARFVALLIVGAVLLYSLGGDATSGVYAVASATVLATCFALLTLWIGYRWTRAEPIRDDRVIHEVAGLSQNYVDGDPAGQVHEPHEGSGRSDAPG